MSVESDLLNTILDVGLPVKVSSTQTQISFRKAQEKIGRQGCQAYQKTKLKDDYTP